MIKDDRDCQEKAYMMYLKIIDEFKAMQASKDANRKDLEDMQDEWDYKRKEKADQFALYHNIELKEFEELLKDKELEHKEYMLEQKKAHYKSLVNKLDPEGKNDDDETL